MNEEKYISFDERQDVLMSIDLIGLLIPHLKENSRYWKWIIIAAQSAVQGSLVCALSGTAGIGALTKKLQSEWLDWFDHRTGPAPKEKLAPFKELLDRGQDPKRLSDPPLVLKEEQVRDLCILHDQLRNNFAHFASKGWSIELAGLPRIIGTAIDVTESLMLNQMQIRIHLEESQITHLQEVIEKIRREILNCRID